MLLGTIFSGYSEAELTPEQLKSGARVSWGAANTAAAAAAAIINRAYERILGYADRCGRLKILKQKEYRTRKELRSRQALHICHSMLPRFHQPYQQLL